MNVGISFKTPCCKTRLCGLATITELDGNQFINVTCPDCRKSWKVNFAATLYYTFTLIKDKEKTP